MKELLRGSERYASENMITKTEFMHHEECPIWLWLVKYRKDLLPKDSDELRRIFATGNAIDQIARDLYPEGIEIEDRFEKGFIETKRMMKNGATVLFQPSAVTPDSLAATADILTQDEETGLWDLREVKSATYVKEEHLIDVAFQRICFERAGIKIGRTFLVHINSKYVREGDIEPEKLLIEEDMTQKVLDHVDMAKRQIEEAKQIISKRHSPDTALIQKCHDPKRCDYLDYYIHGFPEVYTIAQTFPDEHLKALLDKGVLDHTRLPQELLDRVGFVEPEFFEVIDSKGIKKELDRLVYPLYFFDYETWQAGIPAFDGTSPYQQLPFQYSIHIQREKGGPVEHKEFLETTFQIPMPALLAQLKADIGPSGSIVVWNDKFEKLRNKEMAKMYPEYEGILKEINSRMFDLMLLFKFKRKLYRHSEFHESASLKKVLPVICPHLSYSDLEIQEGQAAAAGWPILTGQNLSDTEKKELAIAMLKYCERDTLAMVEILRHLEGKI